MKKHVKILLSICLVIPLLLSSFATTGAAACYPTYTCSTNNIHSERNITVYYTKSEVNRIVARHESLGSNKSLIIGFILGLKSPMAGLSILMYSVGSNNLITPFKTAKRKNTGLAISYKVTIYKGSNAMTRVSNVRYSYR